MYKKKMSAEEAMAFVKEKRAWINPNPGFLRQLSLFQDLGYKIDEEDEKYMQYKQEVEQHRGKSISTSG
jgi:dual specificity phosphatase 12